jgi:hypothetical protein
MTDDHITIAEPKPSKEFLEIEEELKRSLDLPVDIAYRLYEQGKKDGLSNDFIRKRIELALAGKIKERRLREILPLELKRKYTINQDDTISADANSALTAELDTSTATGIVTHNHTVEAFKTDIQTNEAIIKAKILQMGKELDMANKFPKEKIATQILYELSDVINKESTFTSGFVLDCLPAEYKTPPKPEKKVYQYAPESDENALTNVFIRMVNTLSGLPSTRAENMPPTQVVIESKDHMRRILFPWSDDQLIITRHALRPLAPLVSKLQELIDEEVKRRRANAKLSCP